MSTRKVQSSWTDLAKDVLDIEIAGIHAVRDRVDACFSHALELLIQSRGRVVVTGIGKSGLIGRKIAATLSSTGTPSLFLHPVEGAHGDMGMICNGDVVIALSNSGETTELNTILPMLGELGVKIIAMTGKVDSTMGRAADVVLSTAVPKEACPLNLAPTASTTAALALGDALAVCLMRAKSFDEQAFARFHPGGSLGQRLRATVAQLMHTDSMPVVHEDAPVSAALDVLHSGGLGAVVGVDDAGLLKGIFTDGDLRRLLIAGAYDGAAPFSSVMIANPRAASPAQTVGELIDMMEEKSITVLPAVDGEGKLVGVIHLHDLLGKGIVKFGN